jgi:hypothetical protein
LTFTLRSARTASGNAAAAAAIGAAGFRVRGQQADPAASVAPLRGRTSTVCTTGTLAGGAGSSRSDSAESQVYGATTRAEAGATGTLTGRYLGAGDSGTPVLSISNQGQGKIINSPDSSVVLVADGVLAGASAGMVYGDTDTGEDRGLSLGPCTAPAVEQWFTGLGATDTLRSQLVLTNPDDRQASVDLEFFGPKGPLSVPGGSGLIIPAGTSRTLSLEDLLGKVDGDITVRVKAGVGRIAAIARDLRADAKDTPSGVDWHPASAAPAITQVVPAVPGGAGTRRLVIFNPGQRRADARIEILGPDGPFAPADAAKVSINPNSTASVDVATGLARTIGTVRVISDQPVVSAVQSERPADKGASDIAINTAQQPINGIALAPAAVVDGSETEFAISNGGSRISEADVTLYNNEGVSLYHERIPVPAGGSIQRRISQAGPAFLVVRTQDGSSLYGGITLRQAPHGVSGLAAAAFVTPGLAGRARTPVDDPRVAQ